MTLGPSATLPASAHSSVHAERGIAFAAAAIRLIVVVQIVIGATGGFQVTHHRLGYALLTAAAVTVSVTVISQCLTTRRVSPGRWHLADVTVGFVAPPALALLVPAEFYVGTWEVWAMAMAINTSAVAATWMRPLPAFGHALCSALWVGGFSIAAAPDVWRTTATNAITIPGYAVVVAVLAFYIRRLAAEADTSRVEAIAATRALELARYQRTVHDATSILRMLSDDDTPDAVLPGLKLQAEREAMRLRNYLDPVSLQPEAYSCLTVGSMLSEALEGFDDLPLETAVELGAEAPLDPGVWAAARGAVTTILHNVRIHARAHQVVVHADALDDQWEVVISDDGVGFDQSSQRLGFGMNDQVDRALAEAGASAHVVSAPGEGTSITLTGPIARSSDD